MNTYTIHILTPTGWVKYENMQRDGLLVHDFDFSAGMICIHRNDSHGRPSIIASTFYIETYRSL